MSTQHNIYLMYGIKIKDEELPIDPEMDEPISEWGEASAFNTEVKHKDGLYLLVDGMGGCYNVLGKVIGKTDDDYNSSLKDCQEVDVLNSKQKKEVKESIKRNFGIDPDCRYYLINHWS